VGRDDRGSSVAAEDRPPSDDQTEDHHPAEADEEPKPLGQEAPEIIDDAAKIGSKRLHRSVTGTEITAFIGGMSVCFGAVSMAWAAASVEGSVTEPSASHLIGSLFFPVGFIILLVGKSELFTENFFLPVTAVLERRGSMRDLLSLWSVSLVFNLLGGLVFAALISRGAVLADAPAAHMIDLAEHKVHYGFTTSIVKAVFAGWLMTMLTWLLVAARGFGARLVIIWIMGTLIVLGQFNHVVISAAEIFMGMMLGADVTILEWLTDNFLPALAGNIIGGVVFVTLLFYVQALQGRKDVEEAEA
jgi:formate/nitrite transporter FocA (FNT family)